jgi:predicted transcriptional regulator/transcriptional regulator with XRE-family HTH domain
VSLPPSRSRLFAGAELRALRLGEGLGQAAMARRLGISISYLSQIETEERPLTPKVFAAITTAFPLDWRALDREKGGDLLAAVREAAADPLFADAPPSPEVLRRAVEQQPALADRLVRLHAAWRRAEQRLQLADDAIASGAPAGGRPPWEEVRDWFHDAGNYVDVLDRAAEQLAETLATMMEDRLLDRRVEEGALIDRLAAEHRFRVGYAAQDATPLRKLDRATGMLVLDRAAPAETRRFQLAHQLAALEFAGAISAIVASAEMSEEARRLLAVGLANYGAGAIVMPYNAFRAAARTTRHDIDRLCRLFGVSFEQACHRLSTLQRPGARGIPFFFCRVDMAGNITKRHSATRLQFARFGGACPLWIVHEAVAIPDRILVQLAETPDGVRYVSMAKGLVKPSGSFARPPRRYAVALGCEEDHRAEFIYGDGLDARGSSTPIGISCRLCPRTDCDQRAFPPSDRPILIDPDIREVVPYRVL